MTNQFDIAIVGAGFTGLTAGLDLARAGKRVVLLEADSAPGGLAGTFEFRDGVTIEKFYHHWFTNDEYVPLLIRDLGLDDQIVTMPSKTGMYYSGRFWRLSRPLDLLRFTPLSLLDRIRLGWLLLQVRQVKDWRAIEHLSIREWLEPICGVNVFRVVWQPLIQAKFSVYSDAVNAAWMWKKLALRGSTRDAKGREQLAYFKGGFGRLTQAMADEISRLSGQVRCNSPVTGVQVNAKSLVTVCTPHGAVAARQFLFTPSLCIIANLFDGVADPAWIHSLRRINYLGNICLVLQMDRSLSDTYWLNVNDPGFPFVAVIEHTNFDPPAHYCGKHIVFLSRYLAKADPVWSYDDDRYLDFALEQLKRMFPEFRRTWVTEYRLWRAEFAQPVVERNYSQYVPGHHTPFTNAFISTMAQIYPEDRGTNYAIREGRKIAEMIIESAKIIS